MNLPARSDRRSIRFAAGATVILCVVGLLAIPRSGQIEFVAYSLFFEQYAAIEGWPLVLVAAFALIVGVIAGRVPSTDGIDSDLDRVRVPRRLTLVLAVGVAIIAVAGVHLIFREYIFADDEFSAWFQANIFAAGRQVGTIPAAWCRYRIAVTPNSIVSAPDCTWRLSFLPLHSLFQAPFIAMGLGRLGPAVAAAISVYLVSAIARKAWPERPARAWLAAILLATSAQLWFMSMTMFAMSTHLLVTLVWLWLYVDDRRWSNIALPFVGVLALGVHSPTPHLLFAPVFLLRYARNRRWAYVAYLAAVYLVGGYFWHLYRLHTLNPGGISGAVPSFSSNAVAYRSLLAVPGSLAGFITATHLALIASWNNPLLVLGLFLAIASWSRLDSFSRDMLLSLVVTVAVRACILSTQGVGWGYRYVYVELGSMALLGAIGVEILAATIGARRTLRMVAAGAAFSVFVQLPLRAAGVERTIGPYRDGLAWIQSLPFETVVLPSEMVRWGRQLVQNDPFLRNRPRILDRLGLNEAALNELRPDSGKTVKFITRAELRAHHLPTGLLVLGPFIFEP